MLVRSNNRDLTACTDIERRCRCRSGGNSHRHNATSRRKTCGMFVFRWSIPLGARRVMDAVKEGHKNTLSSGKMVALAAGLSVGATVGYMVYRHISSTNYSKPLPLNSSCYKPN